ncbi:MAG TPA: hypothetical protein P5075_07620 [Eubacteriales bacterium]|nr:hypothetical protein [Eubacteriales bacterium]
MKTCEMCKKNEVVCFRDYLLVSRTGNSIGAVSRTEERFSGAARMGLCRKCLASVAGGLALSRGFIGAIVIFVLTLILDRTSFWLALGAGAVIGLGAFVYYQKCESGRRRVLNYAFKDNNGLGTGTDRIEVGDGLYASEEAFLRKYPAFRTNIGSEIYRKVIATGLWKTIVDEALKKEDESAPS